MNNRESLRADMFARVTAFGKEHSADFAPGSEATKHFASLGQIVTALGTASAGQQGGGATAKSVLLDSLRLDVQNIGRTARAIAQDVPGFADKFGPPAGTGPKALTTTATAYVAELKKPGWPRSSSPRTARGVRPASRRRSRGHRRRVRRTGDRPRGRREKHRDGGPVDRRRHEGSDLPRCDREQQIHARARSTARVAEREPHRASRPAGKETRSARPAPSLNRHALLGPSGPSV